MIPGTWKLFDVTGKMTGAFKKIDLGPGFAAELSEHGELTCRRSD
jgi:hypothetical protein